MLCSILSIELLLWRCRTVVSLWVRILSLYNKMDSKFNSLVDSKFITMRSLWIFKVCVIEVLLLSSWFLTLHCTLLKNNRKTLELWSKPQMVRIWFHLCLFWFLSQPKIQLALYNKTTNPWCPTETQTHQSYLSVWNFNPENLKTTFLRKSALEWNRRTKTGFKRALKVRRSLCACLFSR